MQVIIKQTNIKLTMDEKEMVVEKISSLDRYYPKITRAKVEIEKLAGHKSGDIYRAELNLTMPHKLIRVEKLTPDWRKSVEKIKDHAKRTLSREKKKMVDRGRRKNIDN